MKYRIHTDACLLIWLLMTIITICSCHFGLCMACLEEEKMALLQIQDSMGYQPESSLPDWLSDEDCCQWEGIDCSLKTSRVNRIQLYYTHEGEQAPMPWSPDLSHFAKLGELQELTIRGNKISGLVSPEALCTLLNLQQLDLSENSIEGEVHPCWGNMTSLRILNLSKNQFQGNLSTILSNLTGIESVDVSYNHFQGPLSFSCFGNLSRLRHIDLSYNQLEVETETPSWQPHFQLQNLLLAGCKLNYQRKYGIPSFILTQHTLHTLDLSGNFLTGTVPPWMLHNISSVLRLRGNMFSGMFPQGYKDVASPLVQLDISGNYFEGPLPLNIYTLFPRLVQLNVSTNRLNGTIPESLGDFKSSQHLDLSNNHFDGPIPQHLTKNSSLLYLNLSNNSLQGPLLPQGCHMEKLRWLLLRDNHFVGSMPPCLSNSSFLMILDIARNNLSGIISNQFPIFPLLGALLLRGNQFQGNIPRQLCQMTKIQLLDLSKNNFQGNIPSCLNNNLVWRKKFQASSWVPIDFTTKGMSYSYRGLPLTLMTGIDLSANHMSGTIPSEIGELLQLRTLNFSHNHLTGHMPRSIGNLTNLESLDLSSNNLTGNIPWEIGQMDCLSTFSVAFNSLSGRVPSSNHLSTFTEHCYVGNPHLCGEPLDRKCGDVDDSNNNHRKDDDHDHEKDESHEEENWIVDDPVFFYSCVAISYALGFWSVIAPLFFSKNWRRRYYAALDRYIYLFLEKLYVIHDMLSHICRK